MKAGRAVVSAALIGAALLLTAGPARARDPIAEGRYHLRKANALAGDDHCQAAIKEYTLAYQKLHDPVVLFNRAECRRRIGDAADAVADYRAFLDAVPAAPNRAQIEAKIAALNTQPAPVAAVAPPRASRRSPSTAPQPPLTAPLPPPVAPPPPPPTVSLVQPVSPAPAPAPAPSTEAKGPSGHRWLWAVLGVAVAGGAVGAYLVSRTPAPTPPATELGNYRF